tara:strand:- start:696 stop:1661 length:966 start_codon:yes stop_codon:yes gene_type:complete
LSSVINKSVIIGSGSWGKTIGKILSYDLKDVIIITRNIKSKDSETKLQFSTDLKKFIPQAELIIFAVPSHALRENVKKVSPYISSKSLIISATKGLENSSDKISTEVIFDELKHTIRKEKIGVMSGPNLSVEINKGKIALTTIAFTEIRNAKIVQSYFNSPMFRPYTSTDILGVQYGGALKNIIAIASGFLDDGNYGNNAKSSLIVRGLNEIKIIGMSKGGKEETFYGLSGLGDLITTCYSKLSRNYTFGSLISKGYSIDEAKKKISQTIEGIGTAKSAYEIGLRNQLETPIINSIHKIIYEKYPAKEVISELMLRDLKSE